MGLFKKKKSRKYLTLNLNAKLQPMHRSEYYEDLMDKLLRKKRVGCVAGGGSLMRESGEVECCDIDIEYDFDIEERLIELMRQLPCPKGSKIIFDDGQEIPIGDLEGIGIYLNGTDLDEEVYKTCDINHVVDELTKALGESAKIYSFWQGSTETALYFYGDGYDNMRLLVQPFLDDYPLCQKCRVEQIA